MAEHPTPDEAAYEDHWYRSMKALSEHPEAGAVEAETPLPQTAVVEADILTRATHLLERLRAMPSPEP